MRQDYHAVIRKDSNDRWAADLYRDGKLLFKNWQYNWKTRRAMVAEIAALHVACGV